MHFTVKYKLFYLIKRLLISKYADNNITADLKNKDNQILLLLTAE